MNKIAAAMPELPVEAIDAAALFVAVLCWGAVRLKDPVSVVYTHSVPGPERPPGGPKLPEIR